MINIDTSFDRAKNSFEPIVSPRRPSIDSISLLLLPMPSRKPTRNKHLSSDSIRTFIEHFFDRSKDEDDERGVDVHRVTEETNSLQLTKQFVPFRLEQKQNLIRSEVFVVVVFFGIVVVMLIEVLDRSDFGE